MMIDLVLNDKVVARFRDVPTKLTDAIDYLIEAHGRIQSMIDHKDWFPKPDYDELRVTWDDDITHSYKVVK